jgi:hypothetical protein
MVDWMILPKDLDTGAYGTITAYLSKGGNALRMKTAVSV